MRRRLRRSLLLAATFWIILDEVALADNCGTPSDCFFTERAAIVALIGVATLGALFIFGPGAAAATLFWGWDVAELATGRDLLSWEEMPRWQAAMGMIDPTPGNAASRAGRRVGREVAEEVTQEGAEQAARRVDDVVSPSRTPGPGSVPGGRRTPIPANANDANRRSLNRENDSADALARAGYDVEQNPAVAGPKNPDYRIEGEVFDNYAPSTGNARSIWTEVGRKVVNGQTDRVVINVADSPVGINDLHAQFQDWPIEGLREVLIIDGGDNVTRLLP